MRIRKLAAVTVLAHLGVFAASPATAQTPTPQAPTGPTLLLTMAEAEAMGLEANLQLKADRLAPAIAAENLAASRAAFNPNLSAGFSRNSSQSATGSAIEGGSTTTSSSLQGSTSITQPLRWYGGQLSASWNASRSETTRAFPFQNPQLSAGMTLTFNQPIWQGLRIDNARNSVQTALRNRTIADLQLDERIALTRFRIQNAYLSLVGAIAQRDVAQLNLDLTTRQLRDNQSRVEVGTMAPINIIEAEAEVARSEEAVILADSSIQAAQDALRALILDPARPDYWTVDLRPTETPSVQEQAIDLDAAVRAALANRSDLAVQRHNLEISDMNLRLARESTKPRADFTARYSTNGTGGTIFEYGPSPERNVISETSRGFGPVLGDLFRNQLPSWTFGIQLSYPLGKSGAEANVTRGEIQRQRDLIAIQDRELQITTAVRASARDLQTNYKRVQVTQVARERAERQLEAENRRFAVGLSDTFTLQQRQRDLDGARNSLLNATIAYNRSLLEFEAIQRAPVR